MDAIGGAMANQETQVSIRLPNDLLERASSLVESLRGNPDNVLLGLNRSTVLRLAIAKGLAQLESETASPRPVAKAR